MAKGYYVQAGKTIDYTNAGETEIAYQDIVELTSCIAVAACTIPAGGTGTLDLEGVHTLPTESGASGKAFTVGQRVYWDATNHIAVASATSNLECGIVVAAKATTATTAKIKIGV